MSAAARSTSGLANSPASGGDFDRPQVAVIIGLRWRLPPARAIGLMSGTSLDGVDAAWIETDGEQVFATGPSLTLPYDADLRAKLMEANSAADLERIIKNT